MKAKKDRKWNEYPIGTKAHAFNGGYWIRNERGWICDNCGMRRSDYEHFKSIDRAKYWQVNYGIGKARKFDTMQKAYDFGFYHWHEGSAEFKAYTIVRVSNIGRKVVYQQTGDLMK